MGRPACMASSSTRPKGSKRAGLTKASKADIHSLGSREKPGSTTRAPARRRSRGSASPWPTITSQALGSAARSNASISTSRPLLASARPTAPNTQASCGTPWSARRRARDCGEPWVGRIQLSICVVCSRSGSGMSFTCQGATATSASIVACWLGL